MHILFLSHYFPPEVNAPASRTYEHCKRWVERGEKVTVITCEPNCPDGKLYEGYKNHWRKVEYIDGIKVVRVFTYIAPNSGFLKRIINYLSYMFTAIINGLFMRNVDLVVATSPQFFCGWAGVLLHWLRRWPFVLEIRDIWPESIVTVGAMKKSKIISFLEVLEKMMYQAADHIVTVGEGYKKRIIQKQIDPDKISVVINGVDLEQFKTKDDPKTIEKYKCEGKFVCSYIGTVGMAHGLEVMIKAAMVCKVKGEEGILFRIVGDGAERFNLERQASDMGLKNIVFTGRLSKDEMPAIIVSSDACLVHLRGTELFSSVIPSKIFELMAMNTPIIMAVRGEAQSIVAEGNGGVIMEPDDPESLLECINVIKSKGKGAFTGREYVTLHYNRDMLAQNMLDKLKVYAKRN